MKILNLSFRNLNSLQGDFHLDFDQGPLGQAGLFAITGPTGAGKTTILDAICLALFGQTPRLPSGDSEEMMTRHTGECHAEVTFQVVGGRYRSHWGLRRARNRPEGRTQPVEMELVRIAAEESIIEDQKRKVIARVEELTGLDFSRFTRSILLAQGSFAAFLNANDTDRADLLEKMTGTEIYSVISQAAFSRYRAEEERLHQSRTLLNDRHLLDAEGQQQLAAAEAAKAAAVEEAKSAGALLEQQNIWHQKVHELKTIIAKTHADQEELNAELERRQPELARLSQAEKALPLSAPYEVLAQLGQQRSGAVAKCAALTSELPLLQAEQERLVENNRLELAAFNQFGQESEAEEVKIRAAEKIDLQLREATAAATLRRDKLQQLADQLTTQEQALARQRTKVLALQAQLAQCRGYQEEQASDLRLPAELPLIESQLHALGQLVANQRQKKEEQEKIRQTLGSLSQAESKKHRESKSYADKLDKESTALRQRQEEYELLAREKNLRQSEAELQELELARRGLDELAKTGILTRETLAKEKKAEQEWQESSRALTAANQAATALTQEVRAAEGILQQLQEKRTLELLVAKYEEARRQLTPARPCPLCGSLDHPWAGRDLAGGEASQAAIADQQSRLAELRAAAQQGQSQASGLQTAAALHRQRIKEWQEEGARFRQRWQQLAEKSQWSAPVERVAELEAAQTALATTLAAGRQRRQHLQELQETMGRHHLTLRELERQQSEVAVVLQKIKGEQAAATDRLHYLDRELLGLENQGNELIEQLLPLLNSYRETLPEPGREQELLARLRRRHEKMEASREKQASLEATLTTLHQEVVKITSQQEGSRARQREEEQELAHHSTVLTNLQEERTHILGERQPAQERARLKGAAKSWEERRQKSAEALNTIATTIVNKRELLEATQKEQLLLVAKEEAAAKEFASQLQALGFPSPEEFRLALLADDERHALAQLRQRLQERQATIKDRLAEAEPKLTALLAEPAAEDFPTVQAKLLSQEAQLAAAQEELGAIREKLRQQNELRQQEEKLLQVLAGHQREFARWQKLNDLIGSADGKKFRRFAQGLTLDYLIGLANRHLAKLNDRYILQRHALEELGLEVIDSYQANITRPASTLSGGESFLASLALALGLSGLASRKTTIDSLFLDEGFGSLDTETLEVALAALDGLHSSGKTIGIISHVEALKERIPVQIRIHKRAGGVSDLEVVG